MKMIKLKSFKIVLLILIGFILAIFLYGLLQLIEPVKLAPISSSKQPVIFNGDKLLIASDADMVATAYADAKLDRVAGVEDTLTVIDLPLDSSNPQIASIKVSNSVMSWPQIMATSPNGQRAYVVEVRSRPEDGVQKLDTIDNMPEGKYLTVVDLTIPAQPKIIESVALGTNPEHISISPDGQLLAINLQEKGRELLIVKLQADGRLGKRFSFPISSHRLLRRETTEPAVTVGEGTRMDNQTAIWHPSGKYLAVTQDQNSRVGFYQVITADNDDIQVTPYRQLLEVGNHLSHPRFTADGGFLLVCDLQWSTKPLQKLNFLMNPLGEAIAIKFEPESSQPPIITSRVTVGLSPEGFALSPDNSLIATVNMRRTYLPNYIPAWRGKSYSSLSLVKFNSRSGKLTKIDEYGFTGLLPEQVTFDAEGNSLAVVIFNYRQPSPKTGAVEFWKVIPGDQPRLERTGSKIDVVRGAHDLVLVP
jgi:DNA-binding beta-propeller fold protein YncE